MLCIQKMMFIAFFSVKIMSFEVQNQVMSLRCIVKLFWCHCDKLTFIKFKIKLIKLYSLCLYLELSLVKVYYMYIY